MRVERDFLAPLLDGFTRRKGLRRLLPDSFSPIRQTRARKPGSPKAGGSRAACACGIAIEPIHRRPVSVLLRRRRILRLRSRKFLELGGFDPLLAPFYLEDTDLGYHGLEARLEGAVSAGERRLSRAPRHHRKAFQRSYIQAVLKKNFLLFTWKNIHEWRTPVARISASPGPARC